MLMLISCSHCDGYSALRCDDVSSRNMLILSSRTFVGHPRVHCSFRQWERNLACASRLSHARTNHRTDPISPELQTSWRACVPSILRQCICAIHWNLESYIRAYVPSTGILSPTPVRVCAILWNLESYTSAYVPSTGILSPTPVRVCHPLESWVLHQCICAIHWNLESYTRACVPSTGILSPTPVSVCHPLESWVLHPCVCAVLWNLESYIRACLPSTGLEALNPNMFPACMEEARQK
jgi:hypothetical protein